MDDDSALQNKEIYLSPCKQFGPTFDPVSKLSLGQLNSIIYLYSAFLLVTMNKLAGELKRYGNKNLLSRLRLLQVVFINIFLFHEKVDIIPPCLFMKKRVSKQGVNKEHAVKTILIFVL